jgi:hypothetical protein
LRRLKKIFAIGEGTFANAGAGFRLQFRASGKRRERSTGRRAYPPQCNDDQETGPEADWLVGSDVGFQGPWGTTYPANLRLVMDRMTEAQFLARARSEMRPPMPWFNLRAMTDDDLRAMYRFVKSLGPKGAPAPSYAAPDPKVATPYIVFVPQNLPKKTAAR